MEVNKKMFIKEKMKIRATDYDNKTYTGSVYRIVIQLCKDDNNRPHALLFVSQDKNYIKQDGDFGCASLWVDKLKSIEVLEKQYPYHTLYCNNYTPKIKGCQVERRKNLSVNK